jgi:hypothetical protein
VVGKEIHLFPHKIGCEIKSEYIVLNSIVD